MLGGGAWDTIRVRCGPGGGGGGGATSPTSFLLENFPITATPITPSVYLPEPHLVQLTTPSEAWGSLVSAAGGGKCGATLKMVPQFFIHSFAKVLYLGLGTEPLCPPVPCGTYRTCANNFTWLWSLGRAHRDKNLKIPPCFRLCFCVLSQHQSTKIESLPPRSGCIPSLQWEVNQVYLGSLNREGWETKMVWMLKPY